MAIFFDYICPWSYAALDSVERLAREHPVRLTWRPHLLHPEIPVEGMPIEDPDRRAETIQWLKDLAPEAARRMCFPERVPYSFLALQATEVAEDQHLGWPFLRGVFDAAWVRGADIGRLETLLEVASSVGLDPNVLEAGLRSPYYLARTLRRVNESQLLGITATPTLFIGRARINGWHYYEILESTLADQVESSVEPVAGSDA